MKSFNIYKPSRTDGFDKLQFSWWSNEKIKEVSIMEIQDSEDLNDPRLGAPNPQSPCATCGLGWEHCPGHFAHYSFFFPLIHPLRIVEARRDLKHLKLKMLVKQNILNVKHNDAWQSLTVFDLEHEEEYLNYPWLIKHFPISPPSLRPACQSIGAKKSVSFNDITHRLGSLIRIDKAIRKAYNLNPHNKDELRRLLSRLQLAISLLYFPPPGQRESRELSCLSDRLRGKEGRLRLTLLGKRIEFSGRSPISGDIFLDLDECGMPLGIAKKLTVPEFCTDFNREYLSQLLFRNEVKFIQRGNRSINPKYGSHQLQNGDICHRFLRTGDWVLLNRQPSLWSSSVEAFKVKLLDHATCHPSSIRLSVECTPAFNADFDGDEMCCYVPQSQESRAELAHLMASKNHLIVGGNGMVQDSSLGIFLMTDTDLDLGKSLFFDMLMWIQEPYFDDDPFKAPYTSRRMISFLLPTWVDVDGAVSKGVVVGMLNKKIVKKHILPVLHQNDPSKALKFLSSLQRVVAQFFRRRGFSVGLTSLMPDKEVDLSVSIPDNLGDWEMTCLMQKLKNEKAIEAKKLFKRTNPFLQLTSECSGAKGSLMNLIQMKASLGAQLVNGSLIKTYRRSSYGHRVLSSDPFGPLSKTIFTKGYIQGSFLRGLSPQEMFLHAISSRINLLDTALKTANSGYMSRKLWKSLEDSVVQHPTFEGGPMTVRCAGKILCFDIRRDSIKHREVEPGFSIGIVLSQSIGQQIMQLTLNTFHSVGSGNSVVEGIPRMEALINCWCRKLAEQTMLTTPMKTFDIHKMILSRDHVVMSSLIESSSVTHVKKKCAIRIKFNRIKCIRVRVHPWHLEECVNNSELYPAFCAKMHGYEMRLDNTSGAKDCKAVLHKIKNLCVRGEKNIHVFDGVDVVQLTGTTLQQEFETNEDRDFILKLTSNNPLEVAKTLGIEAARQILFRELNNTFNNGVNKLYIDILTEWMTFLGYVCPTTRIGMGKFYESENIFKMMGFERTLRTASSGASKETVATFEGLSESVIVNKLMKHGTGFCDVVKEKAECGHDDCWPGHCKFKIKKKRSFFDASEDDPWLQEDGWEWKTAEPTYPVGMGMGMGGMDTPWVG